MPEIVAARPGIEPRSSCSANEELNLYTTAAPITVKLISFHAGNCLTKKTILYITQP